MSNFHIPHDKPYEDHATGSLEFMPLKHLQYHPAAGNICRPNTHDMANCSPQDSGIKDNTSNKFTLPRIDGIITNSVSPNTYEQSSECKELFGYVDRNTAVQNMKNIQMNPEKYVSSASVSSPQEAHTSLNIQWEDRTKHSNSDPSMSEAAGTSYGIVSHVLEQHFGYKDNSELPTISTHDRSETSCTLSDVSCDLPMPSVREPEIVFREEKEIIQDDIDDTDSTSSAESSSGINQFDLNSDDEEKSKLLKCNECDTYLRSRGNLKVHMRLHTGVHPYICKECGEAFPSCNLYHKHMREHEAEKAKQYPCSSCEKAFNCEKHYKIHRRKHLAPKMFDCQECKQSFATKDRLIRHTKIHYGDLSYFCEKCGELFPNKVKFDEHKMTHLNVTWKCEECNNFSFQSPQELEKHILSVHDTRPQDDIMQPIQLPSNEENKRFACEICSMKFEKISDYYIHRCNHKSERPFKCELCNSTFIKEFHLSVHTAGHKIQTYSCDTCEGSFQSKKSLKIHKQTHCHNLPYECCHCDASFNEEHELSTHMKTHCGDKPFSCDQCEATFRHSSTLKMHQRIHTGDTPFVCSICGSSFIQSHHLQIHLRSHSSNKPYKCNECEASFTKKDYLFAHKTKHINEGIDLIASGLSSDNNLGSEVANLRCTYCEMTFSHQSTLSAHIRKHTGERPFVCDKCGASFLYSSNLTTHRRKHTGERPYKCKECDASFTLKSYLTMHLRKHSGERPFKCDVCEASFTQKTHLSTHKRIHTGEYPYKCEVCGDAFRDGANFWRHKKRHAESSKGRVPGMHAEGSSRLRTKKRTKSYGDGKYPPSIQGVVPQRYVEVGANKDLKDDQSEVSVLTDGRRYCMDSVEVKTENFA
ncbi:Zinc finger protein [Armadillidium nasatum]|uniref:Zinc finger protein n=1 Tax=Armadillidium nasatum TaxID=96803 RepID=A0A5N5ST56_9CRUS|nr:Zinc finger protein [Armadillidium nasatum]